MKTDVKSIVSYNEKNTKLLLFIFEVICFVELWCRPVHLTLSIINSCELTLL